jgi:hypothetical protein
MNSIHVLIFGLPLAAAIAVATSVPMMFAIVSLLMLALWLAPGIQQRA